MNIIVTGASKGIGFETVKVFARSKQNHVLAIARSGKLLKELAEECKRVNQDAHVTPYEFDLQQFDFYPLILQRIQTYLPHCDILVNNAGKLVNKPFEKTDANDFDEIFNVNVKSLFLLTQAILPMMNKGGHVVNISSMGGVQGSQKFSGLSAYSASKGAVAVFTEALAEELKDNQIYVNCLALGGVGTELFERAFPHAKAAFNPNQIAQYIADFALNGHKYFNGKVLQVSVTTP
ncbi:MAG: SDR family oxidoreductase [bacterium]